MPFNTSRSAQFFDKEILKYPTGLEAIKSAVIDGNAIARNVDPEARTVVPAGTVLKLSLTRSGTVVPYDNGTASDRPSVYGILARPVDFIAQSTGASEAVPVLFHMAVFATSQIVGFTAFISGLVSSMTTCKF